MLGKFSVVYDIFGPNNIVRQCNPCALVAVSEIQDQCYINLWRGTLSLDMTLGN